MATKLSTATVVARRIQRQRVRTVAREIQALNLEFVGYRIGVEQYVPRHRELVAELRRVQAGVV